ncbi:MAG: type II toxin-antitoxin system VapC family toxin [Defluviitaleaceae bacterium]|nr:type II toxin-antitoxin system VapC family toxin [Defluviitaleaceae bacterium]
MKLLLDTHTALWWVNEHEKLPPKVKALLLDETHTLYFSAASAWEIAIKVSLGRFTEFEGGVSTFLSQIDMMPINLISILPRHIEVVETLPFIHRDPFDRILIATAKADNMTLLTVDENIKRYGIDSIW